MIQGWPPPPWYSAENLEEIRRKIQWMRKFWQKFGKIQQKFDGKFDRKFGGKFFCENLHLIFMFFVWIQGWAHPCGVGCAGGQLKMH